MPFETALRARVKSPAVMAIAKSADWAVRPQGKAFPAVVLQVISDARDQTMAGFQAKRATRVQIDCMALDAATKVSLREAVLASVTPRATVSGVAFERIREVTVRDLSENTDTAFIHRDSIEAVFWHREVET